MSGSFRILEHVVPCQNIREYPGATAVEDEENLKLAVKQYIPLDNPNPQPGDITILGAHANGFGKELYEPLWEEIHARSKQNGFRIRSIWIADVAHQGQSGVLNEDILGNDPSWMDHPRDLLLLINLKRKEMPRPIIGIGHSLGGNNLVNLSLMHPRLITSLILLDPVISSVKSPPPGSPLHIEGGFVPPVTIASTHRRDIWPSREAAAESFRKNKFYQAWDPRVLNLFIKHGLRELPTAIHRLENTSTEIPKGKEAVTLTTTRHQEVFTFNRPNFNGDPKLNIPFNRRTHPDLEYVSMGSYPFYRPEVHKTFVLLPHLRPSTMYIFGEESEMSRAEDREEKLKATGTGIGGSGGYPEGRVKPVVLKRVGHLVPMEAVGQTASLSAEWIGAEIKRWRSDEEEFKKERAGKSRIERMTIDDEWRDHAKRPVRSRKPTGTKL